MGIKVEIDVGVAFGESGGHWEIFGIVVKYPHTLTEGSLRSVALSQARGMFTSADPVTHIWVHHIGEIEDWNEEK